MKTGRNEAADYLRIPVMDIALGTKRYTNNCFIRRPHNGGNRGRGRRSRGADRGQARRGALTTAAAVGINWWDD
jgi:hypothetical protein